MSGRLAHLVATVALILAASPALAQGAGALERAFAPPRTAPEVRRRLALLDADQLPALFRLRVAGEMATDGGRMVLGPGEHELVHESLVARPRREIVALLQELASRPLEAPARREAQRLLEAVGTAEHLRLLARVTTTPGEKRPLAPDLRSGFAAALGAILARDGAAIAQVPGFFSEAPATLSSSIVEALARQPGDAPTRILAALLGRTPGLDPLLLLRLAERGRIRHADLETIAGPVRRYLRQRDPALVAAAARACGRLGDDGAVESLVGLLDHAEERVRDAAFEALRAISGLDHGRESARWTSWYRTESRWWESEAVEVLVHVERGRGVEFVRAACSALEHRLYRDRIAESFVEALQRGGPNEARMACRALEQLGSSVGVAELVEFLDHPDAALRDAAWRALKAITGRDLPPEPEAWEALLDQA